MLRFRRRRRRGAGVGDAAAEDGERAALVDEGVDVEGNGDGGEAVEGEILLVAEELLGAGLAGGGGRWRRSALHRVVVGGGGAGWLTVAAAIAVGEVHHGEQVCGLHRFLVLLKNVVMIAHW